MPRMSDQPQPPSRPSAQEVFKTHGIATIGLLLWVLWCVRDGWFRPDYEHIGFSRLMGIVSLPFLIYTALMAGSAGLTLYRQRNQPPPTETHQTGQNPPSE